MDASRSWPSHREERREPRLVGTQGVDYGMGACQLESYLLQACSYSEYSSTLKELVGTLHIAYNSMYCELLYRYYIQLL
jgi:hypothetical protein